jgi:hypothetical protein
MTTSSKREPQGWTRRRLPQNWIVTAGLLTAMSVAVPAWANPAAEDAVAASGSGAVNLHLDGRTAGRLLAAGDSEASPEGDKISDDKDKPAEKSDEIKLTVTKGAQVKKQPAAGSDDSLAFLKDWPFWAIVGGVVLAGAATFMIVENHNQKHACNAMYDGGCFGAK